MLWTNQQEAIEFAMSHSACMLDMDMGTGKTRVAIEVAFARPDVSKILVVCPKAVVPVWRENLSKFKDDDAYLVWDEQKGTVATKSHNLKEFLFYNRAGKIFVVINYDSVWRKPMGDMVLKMNFDLVVLDESHRAKSAGSKVSKYLATLGRRTKYRMCLSGTPMANSPLDVYGQYRFLSPDVFGTNYYNFLSEYAVLGGPDRRFIVGFKNQRRLNNKFASLAYTCKMADIKDRLKLPDILPPTKRMVQLPSKDYTLMKTLNKEFVAECEEGGHVIVSNVLVKLIRLQQIASGFCLTQENLLGEHSLEELNSAKESELTDILTDIAINEPVVVFGLFTHDLDAIRRASESAGREYFEISGRVNNLELWKERGGVLGVQIQAGAEGIDLTNSHYAIYFSLPHSLALYNQSQARLYRPGQEERVSFIHLIAERTIDESLYKSLQRKEDIIQSIKNGTFDFGYIH